MKPDQVSLAIGKGGFNIKLAGRLTGFEIDVYRDTESELEDVDLVEFSDEIDQWIIDALKAIGCDTAKSVLEITTNDLVSRTDLEVETINEVVRILKNISKRVVMLVIPSCKTLVTCLYMNLYHTG